MNDRRANDAPDTNIDAADKRFMNFAAEEEAAARTRRNPRAQALAQVLVAVLAVVLAPVLLPVLVVLALCASLSPLTPRIRLPSWRRTASINVRHAR